MKRKFTHLGLIIFLFIGINLSGFAQIQVGTGTNTSQHLPIYAYYGYTYSQVIYLASEINASGDITELKWYFNGSSLSNSNDWTIYIGHTTKTDFSSTSDWVPVTGMTQVYSGTFTDPGGSGWITFDITDWTYNGTDNIVVAVDENASSYNGSSDMFYCTSVSGNRGIEYHNDSNNPDPASPPSASGTPAYIANIIFEGISQACPAPTAQTESSVGTTSAQLGWTSGGSTAWDIEWGLNGFTQGSGTMITGTTSNPYTLNSLNAATSYDWYVRDNCGGASGESTWIGPSTFTTACATVSTLSEDFPTASTPICWGNSGGESWLFSTGAAYGAGSAGDHTPGGGTNYAWIDGSSGVNTNELLTPFVDLSGFTTPMFEFYYFSNNTDNPGENNNLIVDFWDGAAWHNLLTYANDNAAWQKGSYDLSGYTITGDVQFRFVVTQMATGDSWYNDILVDDVEVKEAPLLPPSCATVDSPTDASSGINTDGSLTWNTVTDATGYKIFFGSDGAGTSDPTNIENGTDLGNVLTYAYTGLSAQTDYYWKIVAYNANGDATGCSIWSFTTGDLTCTETESQSGPDSGPTTATISSFPCTTGGTITGMTLDANIGSSCPSWYSYNIIVNGVTIETSQCNQTGYDLSGYLPISSVSIQSVDEDAFSDNVNMVLTLYVSYVPPSCPSPTAQTESSITTTSAILDWTTGGSSNWDIEWGPKGFTQGSGTMVSNASKPYSIGTLTHSTEYDWYVRDTCGVGDVSTWTGPSTFASACGSVTSYPFDEGFENAGSIPVCWTQEYGTGTTDWTFENGGHNGHPANAQAGSYNALFYNTSGDVTKLVTASLDLSGGTSPILTFWHTQTAWGGDQDELRVYYRTSLTGAWTLIPNAEWTTDISDWTKVSMFLPHPSNDYYIAFEAAGNYGYGVALDNVKVVATPPVPVSDWAIYIGILLIGGFIVVRTRNSFFG